MTELISFSTFHTFFKDLQRHRPDGAAEGAAAPKKVEVAAGGGGFVLAEAPKIKG